MMDPKCLLCHSQKLEKWEIIVKPQGNYWFCTDCEYVFREPAERLELPEERGRYELHQNEDSPGYRRFLTPVVESVLNLKPKEDTWRGLDYGCGPSAFLSGFFAEYGVAVDTYDPLFQPDQKVFTKQYDFITCTEVFEHLFDPRCEIERLHTLLKPRGILAVMTSPLPARELFKSWSYRRDDTHVGFFARKSFEFIARHWNWDLLEAKKNLWVLRKRS